MLSTPTMPSPSSLFSAYASMAASMMFLRSIATEFLPHPLRAYLTSTFLRLFHPKSTHLTLVFDELCNGMIRNQIYDAAELFLAAKIGGATERLKIYKTPKEKTLTIRLEKGEKVADRFDGADLVWRFVCSEQEKSNNPSDPFGNRAERVKFFELSFEKKHKELVMGFYIPEILERAKAMKESVRALKMHTLSGQSYGGSVKWESVNLEHPATFETLAMEADLKKTVMADLDRFVKRKEYYRKAGRAWKRGYLLYGPPGTGKSSLVAAMANYLRFDVYDLQLANIMRDSDLRRLLVATANRSILVIEDIDCSVDIPDRRHSDGNGRKLSDAPAGFQVTLSGLLNFIDGLWSTCGDERIIVFTTNHKEKLDPALLRPGRMDMHIHMSYCSAHAFHVLAANYLGVPADHRLCAEIGRLLEATPFTPAQVAEELMKSEDADIALEGLVKAIKRKKMDSEIDSEVVVTSKKQKMTSERKKMDLKIEPEVVMTLKKQKRTSERKKMDSKTEPEVEVTLKKQKRMSPRIRSNKRKKSGGSRRVLRKLI